MSRGSDLFPIMDVGFLSHARTGSTQEGSLL